MNDDRLKLTNEELDYTIIEILKEDEIFKKIKYFFEIDNYIMNNDSKNNYKNQDICIVQYPEGGDLSFAQGGIKSFDNYKIKHLVSTRAGSTGSPILLQNNFKIIGIHKAGNARKSNENIGTFMKDILNDCFNIKLKNEIICEYNIKKKDNIQILNSYEEFKRNNKYFEGKGIENEKEIKNNCEIYLNENKRSFCYKYELEGKNIIKIKCINLLNNTNFMFCDCSSLTSLNLSNFNTNNIKDMNHMFSHCSSLISLNLNNFNTDNVKDMSWMFLNCSSLTSLNLSNFNTNNVNNMSGMFSFCSSLTSLNLSNFYTNNVNNMRNMFNECSSLTSLNLSNFNTNNVEDMSSMFFNCSSLTSLNCKDEKILKEWKH